MTRRLVTLSMFLLLAVAVRTSALARKPTSKELATAKAHFKQGTAYYEAGAYGDAVNEYEKAYALAQLPMIIYNVGQAYRMQGDKLKAITAYERYLAAVPEGTLADEARAHVATLKLKLQVEAAEVAKQRAMEEAAASRRRAEELDAARRRAEAEAAARLRNQREDAERLARIAAEQAERQRQKRVVEQLEYKRQLAQAQLRGQTLRRVGRAAIVIGSIAVAASVGVVGLMVNTYSDLNKWDDSYDRWTMDYERKVKDLKTLQTWALAQTICGGVVLIAGIVLYRVGVSQRARATESVTAPISVEPLLGPGFAGVTIGGRF